MYTNRCVVSLQKYICGDPWVLYFLWQRVFLSGLLQENVCTIQAGAQLAHNVQCTLFITSSRCFGGKSCKKAKQQSFNEVLSLIVEVLSFFLCLVLLRRKAVGEMLMDRRSALGPRGAKEIQMSEPERSLRVMMSLLRIWARSSELSLNRMTNQRWISRFFQLIAQLESICTLWGEQRGVKWHLKGLLKRCINQILCIIRCRCEVDELSGKGKRFLKLVQL